MTVNVPPSAADIARLVARVEQLERAPRPRGARVVNDLEDVNADYPADGNAILYDEASGKYVLGAATGGTGGTGGAPTDWVEWDISSTQGPYTWNGSEQQVLWVDDITNATHGSAITLSSGHAVVAEDGWYTVYGYVAMEPVTVTAVYDFARLRLRGTSSPQFTIGSDFIDWPDIVTEVRPPAGVTGSAAYKVKLPFTWTGYLVSGSPIEVFVQMSAASNPGSSWQVTAGLFNMLKLSVSGGGGGLPITEDDGTYTGSIDFNSSRTDGLVLTLTENAGSVLQSWVELSPANGVFLWSPVNDMLFETDAGGFLFDSTGASSTAFQVIDHSAKLIYLFSAAVTNDGGAVQIEAGSNGTGRGVVELTATGGMIFLDSSEVLFRGCTATPTSADLSNNGDFALWFDPATKVLSVKGRDSGGTIRNLTIGTLT